MGLDHYLSVVESGEVPPNWEEDFQKELDNPEETEWKSISFLDSSDDQVITWRKFNALHGFFDKVARRKGRAEGVENCRPLEVSRENLEELVGRLVTVDKAEEAAKTVLPTTPGFFFGSLEYDDYYFQNVKETLAKLTQMLSDHGKGTGESDAYRFFYYAWW